MFTRPNLPSPSSLVPKFLTPGNASAVGIRPVKVHEIETAQEKRARSLKHLLKLNHVNNAILYNDLKFHNHAPHVSFLILLPSTLNIYLYYLCRS